MRIGSFDGEIEAIVFVQRIARLDTDLTFVKPVRRIERQELDRGAAVGGNIHGSCFRALCHPEPARPFAWRPGCSTPAMTACDANLLWIVYLGGRGDAFHHPVGVLGIGHRMEYQLGVGAQAQVGEGRRHGRFLHVAREMHFERNS